MSHLHLGMGHSLICSISVNLTASKLNQYMHSSITSFHYRENPNIYFLK